MRLEVDVWVLCQLITVRFFDVPDADAAIVTSRKQQAFAVLVPGEAIALLRVTDQAQVCSDFVVLRCAGMLRVVEDVHLAVVDCLGRDDLRVLRHVAGPVDLALVINLNVRLNSGLLGGNGPAPAQSVRVVVEYVFLVITGVLGRLKW